MRAAGGWAVAVAAGGMLMWANWHLYLGLRYSAISLAVALLFALLAIGLLRGRNWVRLLVLWGGATLWVLTVPFLWVTTPRFTLGYRWIGLVAYGLIAACLLTPAARGFFMRERRASPAGGAVRASRRLDTAVKLACLAVAALIGVTAALPAGVGIRMPKAAKSRPKVVWDSGAAPDQGARLDADVSRGDLAVRFRIAEGLELPNIGPEFADVLILPDHSVPDRRPITTLRAHVDGTFGTRLPPGDYQLYPVSMSTRIGWMPHAFRVEAGQTSEVVVDVRPGTLVRLRCTVDGALPDSGTVRGTILDGEGRPLVRKQLRTWPHHPWLEAWMTEAHWDLPEGEYVFRLEQDERMILEESFSVGRALLGFLHYSFTGS